MKCEIALESMVLAAYGELAADQAMILERHLAECEGCAEERAAMGVMFETLEMRPIVEPSPTLLTQSRMRLDEALDAMPSGGFFERLRVNALRWMGNVQSAPALATLLIGCGFLAGNFTHRYQAGHPAPPPTTTANAPETTLGDVANVKGIQSTDDPEVVQVYYNRLVPDSMAGRLNDPRIRKLLLMGAENAAASSVRKDSVAMMVHECQDGHGCVAETDGKGIRGALLTAVKTDDDPDVRMLALQGLQPYVGQDRRVRDALLVALLHDPSAQVRRTAVTLLQPVQADSSVRQVLRTVSTTDANPYVRTVSYQALENAGAVQ